MRLEKALAMLAQRPASRPASLRGAAAAFALLFLSPRLARADPWFDGGHDALEDAFVDGDIDEEDVAATTYGVGAHLASADFHGQTWLGLIGFSKQLVSGRNEIGAMVVVGLALDRIAAGRVHALADPPRAIGPPSPSTSGPPAPPAGRPPDPGAEGVSPRLARECVAAALRTAGLGVDDSKLDALVSRARSSAWLPETRMRAMRLWHDASRVTTTAASDTPSFYDAMGANLLLELRLTWRFDRLLYAGDEPSVERMRLERQDARARAATRVLDVLFAWQRALVAIDESAPASRERIEARIRATEAAATLDVLTGGWFAARSPPAAAPGADDDEGSASARAGPTKTSQAGGADTPSPAAR
jgi:hypothetical protein